MKSTNGTASANGTAKDSKEVVKPQITTPVKPELSNIVIPISKKIEEEQKALPPIGDRFLKMDELYSHRMKWEKLNASLEKLKQLQLSSDGRNDTIVLNDSKNNSFTTSNPDVFKKVVYWLIEDVSHKLAETAALIII